MTMVFNILGVNSIGLTGHRQSAFTNTITSVERRLYFSAAHAHLKAGCPALALEVLGKNSIPN